MTRQEFIERLRLALNNRIPAGAVEETVRYYEGYIENRMREGLTEEAVLGELGDPRLIARTIIDTNGGSAGTGYSDPVESADYAGYNGTENAPSYKVSKLPSWLVWLIIILVVVLIVGAVLSVLSFLAPIILPIILVLFLVKLFRDWLN